MANFTRYVPSDYYYSKKDIYRVEGTLTRDDIDKLNIIDRPVILQVKNTKGLDKDLIKNLNSNISFNVLGGVDYTKKKKFDYSEYIDRTIYSPVELSKIIEVYEKIERGIDYSWSDTEKCLYVYKSLMELLHYKRDYERSWENGKDVARSLTGLLYGKSVCSGIALIFKEAMDRLDIPCEYQNKAHHHSWNVVKLDGAYRALDLTWDIANRDKTGKMAINCFGFDEKFYENKHHNIKDDPDEVVYPIIPFYEDYILKCAKTISKKNESEMNYYNGLYVLSNKDGNVHFVYMDGELSVIHTPNNGAGLLNKESIRKALRDNDGYIGCNKSSANTEVVNYVRDDGTNFILHNGREINDQSNVKEYVCYRISIDNGQPVLKRNVLLSETSLIRDHDPRIKRVIANRMLSEERLERKVRYYNGYVGFIGKNGGLYYDKDFERNCLNIPSHSK